MGTTFTQTITTTLADHPDRAWRPTDLAAHIGCTTHQAAVALRALWERDLIARHYDPRTRRSTYQQKEWPE